MIFQASHYCIGIIVMVIGLLTSILCLPIIAFTFWNSQHMKMYYVSTFLRYIVPKADAFIRYLLEGD